MKKVSIYTRSKKFIATGWLSLIGALIVTLLLDQNAGVVDFLIVACIIFIFGVLCGIVWEAGTMTEENEKFGITE